MEAVKTVSDLYMPVSGKITELKSGEDMPGVNIMVKGTYYGTASDLQGRYLIDNVSPGSYDVEVSSKRISYFKNQKLPIEYWIALEPESSYGN